MLKISVLRMVPFNDYSRFYLETHVIFNLSNTFESPLYLLNIKKWSEKWISIKIVFTLFILNTLAYSIVRLLELNRKHSNEIGMIVFYVFSHGLSFYIL